MQDENYIIKERQRKLAELEQAGINPYPAKAKRTHTNEQVLTDFDKLLKKDVTVVGRLRALRSHGKLTFAQLEDGTAQIQLAFEQDKLGKDKYKMLKKFDVGDFIQVTGKPFLTQKEVKTVEASEFVMLSKSMRPLPEKWHGIKDEEKRYRQRYLDMLLNPEVRDLFVKKQKFWNVTRNFLEEKGFLEVETPTLETTTGGAEAAPFRTHHNAFDLDVCLRISVGELWQKRLMAAGFEKTFEIGKVFRNEGSDPNHLQEFTNMEFYWAYANYEDGMGIVTELYRRIATEVFGKTKFSARGFDFDLADDWTKIDYQDEIKKQTGVDVLKVSEAEMKTKLQELKVEYEGESKERLTDTLWKFCRKNIGGPAFLVNHPKLVSPLSKTSTDDENKTERFQVILAGTEVGNGYSELNDSVEQRQRFEIQQKLLEAGDEEAMMPDLEFVEMLEYGMPPTCGFGFGEMLFAFMLDKPVRETTLFPLMKPEQSGEVKKAAQATSENSFSSELVNINSAVSEKFPQLKIGAAIIEGLSVKKSDPKIDKFASEILQEIDADKLLKVSPILDEYRKLFKAIGMDPTRKKPSPIALLERIAAGKELYQVNSLVDLYNALVIKNQVSIGAFDLDNLNLPVDLTFAQGGEEFLAIGEDKAKKLKPGELIFRDKERVITRGLNYRDADVTKTELKTKNIALYVDGNQVVDTQKLESILDEATSMITKYCGGKVTKKIISK